MRSNAESLVFSLDRLLLHRLMQCFGWYGMHRQSSSSSSIGPGLGLSVTIKRGEMCGDGGATFQKPRQEPIDEHGNSDLSGGVVHTPDADAGLGQVGVHLDEVPLAVGQRDGDFLQPAMRQSIDARPSQRDCRQALKRLVVDPAKIGHESNQIIFQAPRA